MRYRITGRVTPRRWQSSSIAALTDYNRAANRAGYCSILHMPGDVAGDVFDDKWHAARGTVSGARDGHGIVTLTHEYEDGDFDANGNFC